MSHCRLLRLLIAQFAYCGVSASVAFADDVRDWSTYNYDVLGSRHNAAEKSLSPDNVHRLIPKWRFPTEDADAGMGVVHATPTVVNGYVYFGTVTYPAFYKLAPNGTLKWIYHIGGKPPGAPPPREAGTRFLPGTGVYGSALVTENSVFFADANGVIYALDRESGKEKWTLNSRSEDFPGAHGSNVFLASPIMAEGLLIFGGGAYEHAGPLMPGYRCCRGRGCVLALDPATGDIVWKYDVGPEPETFDPPLIMKIGERSWAFHYGPSTSSVWCTPSYDAVSHTIFFGTDVHNSPRKPSEDDPRNYTRHSAAMVALDVRTGEERWITQITKGDVWNYTLPHYDPDTGLYKDQSIGDTPKIYSIDMDGETTKVVGFGTKNGGFYVLRADSGEVVAHTPLYLGPPVKNPEVDPRTLALPGNIGGLQTGCATDGHSIFTNGIDALNFPPTGGRVTSISLDTRTENWRHERPIVPKVHARFGRTFKNVGDPVASGIAVANGVAYFTTLVSNQLVAVDTSTGEMLKEIPLGPVFAGPSVSRGRVYIGTGNTLFNPLPSEDFFPKRDTGVLYSFGLPEEDEVDRLGEGNE